ncbi:hypothetical protein L5515_004007 [Caenorhabditis briggsae]|uniref:Uncharacterized protein n=1 Tax=Caenorhabditis briggsae TaxID=6238 RepID=A0AAE9JBU4_CAEBR|nr:hypothetical protein L5515_004007 [Caenorhabditis briggsae]
MEDDSDVWGKDEYCNACRVKCVDEYDKQEHRKTETHLKKWNLHKFFSSSIIHGTVAISEMLERYKLKKMHVVGLHQCQEIQQIGLPDHEKANFWTCNICYEAGATFESADAHLNSMVHIRNYMEECEYDNEKIEAEFANDECGKYEKYRSVAEEIFQQEDGINGLQPPSILRMPLSKEDGKKQLGIKDTSEITFQPYPGEPDRTFMYCSTCNEIIPVHIVGKYTKDRAQANHFEHPSHQRCATICSIINEFDPEEIFEEYKSREDIGDIHWIERSPGQWYLSQPCGYRYCVRARNETMCTVCYALVDSDKISDHFSSEYHAFKYLNMLDPYKSYIAHQLSGRDRREKARKKFIAEISLEQDNKKILHKLTRFPATLKNMLEGDVHVHSDPPVEVIDDYKDNLPGTVFRFCQVCRTYIEFRAKFVDTEDKMNAIWTQHVLSPIHFQSAAMSYRISFDPSYFVPYSSTIFNIDTEVKGVWKVNKDVLIQTQCDVGLEYMIEDEKSNEVACQCCQKVFSKNPVFVNQHIRSYDHLKQYIFLTAPDLVRTLLGPETDENKRKFLMDFLQRSSGIFQKRMTLYSKLKTLELSAWPSVSQRLVQSSLFADESGKDIYETVLKLVDEISCDGGNDAQITAREALIASRMVIINTHRGSDNELASVVCRCDNCQLLVIADASTWQKDIFTSHLCSEEHHKRSEVCKTNVISAFGILEEKSSYTVKPLVQNTSTKKIIWQWNAEAKKHEYVHGIVGLDDIIERRFPATDRITGISKKQADFYCTVCAEIFPKRASSLESHVKEMSHCVNWIHKHRPTHIRDLMKHMSNQTADKGKEYRKYLSGLLKEVQPPEAYCILVYDPFDVEEKRQTEIMLKIQAEEKAKKDAEKMAAVEQRKLEKAERAAERKRKEKEEWDRNFEEENRRRQLERDREREREMQRENLRNHALANVHKYEKDSDLQNRLKFNSIIANQKNAERREIDVQKAKLEAEKLRLLSHNPNMASSAAMNPKLVIMPQLTSQPPAASHNPYVVPVSAPAVPPGINTSYDVFNSVKQPPPAQFFGPPPSLSFPQNQPTPSAFPVQFRPIPQAQPEIPAYRKRPSIRGKLVDPVIHDRLRIRHKGDLLKHMRSMGAGEILDPAEIPREMSRNAEDNSDAYGITSIAEIVCLDDPSLDSYMCTICDHWAAPEGMIHHLCSQDHKSTYMYHNCKNHYQEIMKEKDVPIRKSIFKNFVKDLKTKEAGKLIKLRMKTIIDKATIERLWPGYEEYFYGKSTTESWSSSGFKTVVGPTIVLPEVINVPVLIGPDDMKVEREGSSRKQHENHRDNRRRERSRSRDRDRSRRSRSRSKSRDRRRRSRDRRSSRSRSRSRDRHYRDRRDRRSRSRSRSRDPSRSRSDSGSNHGRKQSGWEQQTDSFLASLGNGKSNTGPTSSQKHISTAADFNAKLATVRDLTQSGAIQGTQIDSFVTVPPPQPAPVAPTHSAESRKIEANRKLEQANRQQKVMGLLMALEGLLRHVSGNVPRETILAEYARFGLNEEEGNKALEEFIKNTETGKFQMGTQAPKKPITEVISSLGIGINPTPVQQYSFLHQHQPPQPVQLVQQQPPPQQYGISSQTSTSSAYSQAFGSRSVPQPQQEQDVPRPFYSNPSTSMNHGGATDARNDDFSDGDASDEDYSDVYAAIGKQVRRKPISPKQTPEKKPEDPILPGQKMALARTILPNGARVGDPAQTTSIPKSEDLPVISASPSQSSTMSTPSATIAPISATATLVPNTSQSAPIPHISQPPLPSSLGIPAPIAVTKALPQQPPQQQYLPQQQMMYPGAQQLQQGYPPQQPGYQQNVYQQPYLQQMYQHPQQSQYAQQYGIQQPVYQQQPPQQQVYQQQFYQPAQQQQQYLPVQQMQQQPPPQQYYQQPPPAQNASQYGIGGTPQQHFWPGQ